MKYLYGASVQGIQGFIFETNKLREIVGASELVEQICTIMFEDSVSKYNKDNLILGAAGNIKYIFDNERDCQNLVHSFPKKVMTEATGITISQAVVSFQGGLKKEYIESLEEKLRIQRNKPIVQHGLGLMITERARKTGKSGVKWKKNEGVIDLGQKNKNSKSEDAKNSLLDKIMGKGHNLSDKSFPFDINDIVERKDREWIAVVHADGNNLGKIIIKMADELPEEHTQAAFRTFSERLEEATIQAASDAFYDTVYHKTSIILPIRPVVLGGDDLTVIIRGDLAMDFTEKFLQKFEEYTEEKFSDFGEKFGLNDFNGRLTACAGIAFIKPNYPFHYGVRLSEELCDNAKKTAKRIDGKITPSCVSFHKVQASFVESFDDIIKKELTANNIFFNFGPYFLNPQKDFETINTLKYWVNQINKEDAPKGSLRNWLGELEISVEKAHQSLERIKTIHSRYSSKLSLNEVFRKRTEDTATGKKEKIYTHIFDVMTLSTIEKK